MGHPFVGTKNEEKRVTAASWPSVGSGVDRRMNACTGQDAFLACVGLLRGRRNGLTVFVDDPSLTSTLRNRDAEYVFRMLVGVRVTWKGNEERLWSERD